MKDKGFLTWIHARLEHVHGTSPNTDYMGKLRSIIKALPEAQETPNTAPSIEEEVDKLNRGKYPQ